MAIYVRPFVQATTHVEGCRKRNCGPGCVRIANGWEYHIKLVLPNGDFFEERKKSPVNVKSSTQRYAEERAAHVVRASVVPLVAAKREVKTVSEFQQDFLTYSRTNNKPSTVSAKEGLLKVHLIPFFGRMRMDAIGPAELERYKAAKLEQGLHRKSINNHLTALRKLLNREARHHPRAPTHLREPPRDARRVTQGGPGAARPREHRDDAPLLAPHPGREAGCSATARCARHSAGRRGGDGVGVRNKAPGTPGP